MIAITKEDQKLKFPSFHLSEQELDIVTKVKYLTLMMMMIFSASAINCMPRQICWHANFICALMKSKQLLLEHTALRFTQHTYGVAIVKQRCNPMFVCISCVFFYIWTSRLSIKIISILWNSVAPQNSWICFPLFQHHPKGSENVVFKSLTSTLCSGLSSRSNVVSVLITPVRAHTHTRTHTHTHTHTQRRERINAVNVCESLGKWESVLITPKQNKHKQLGELLLLLL